MFQLVPGPTHRISCGTEKMKTNEFTCAVFAWSWSLDVPWNQCISWFFRSIKLLEFGVDMLPLCLTILQGCFFQIHAKFRIIQVRFIILAIYFIGLGGNYNILPRYDLGIFGILTFEQLLFSTEMRNFLLISKWILTFWHKKFQC